MQRKTRIMATVVLVAMAFLMPMALSGCAQNEVGKEIQARDVYIGVIRQLDNAKNQHQLSERDRVTIVVPAKNAAKSALDQWLSNATATPPVPTSAAQLAFNAALAALQKKLSDIASASLAIPAPTPALPSK